MQTVNINSCGQMEQTSCKIKGLRYQISSITDKGFNKEENEDNVLAVSGNTILGPSFLLAVADGVGGLDYGFKASHIAIEGLKDWWNITLRSIMYRDIENMQYLINESLSAALDKINIKIYEQGMKAGKRMATTVSAIFILKDWYCLKHVGDSRIYLLTRDLRQLTEDHNLLNQYLKSGSMDELRCGYKALNNVLTKCMGMKAELEPFEQTGKISDMECILLCTDGLYKLLSTIEIDKVIRGCSQSAEGMQKGLQFLIQRARKRGEKDDISAVLMAVKKESKNSLRQLLGF